MTCKLPFDITPYRSILCLNGDLPPKTFFDLTLPLIAADGAANTLIALGLKPSMVIGDLDSITPENLANVSSHYHYDQNYCDFQKSLFYLEEKHLLPTIVVGVNGGYLDHILNNINILLTSNNIFYAPPLYGFTLQNGEKTTLHLPLQTKISLLGIPEAVVSSQGLQWPLDYYKMAFPGNTSCYNRTTEEEVALIAHSGRVLVLVYS